MENKFEKAKLYDYLGDYLIDLLIDHKAYVAGGTITSLFCNREINDIDVYFRSKDDCISFMEEIYNNAYLRTHTDKATLFIRGEGSDVIKLQLIHFDFFDSAEAIFDKFDYTVCMGAFDFATEKFILHTNFLKDNCYRMLRFNSNTAYPIISLLRIQKYEEKGYKISKSEFIRVVLTCVKLNITSYKELSEQIGGMYGINYDTIFNINEEFSFDSAITKLQDLYVNDDYFNNKINYLYYDMELCELIGSINNKFTTVQGG